MSGSNIVVTGASGVLGTAVHKAFEKALRYEVVGLKNKSTASHLVQLDLTDMKATKQKLEEIKPTCLHRDCDLQGVIHCAAERRPDVAEKDQVGTQLLNVGVPGYLAELAWTINFTLVYISTDYVFDGRSPPPGGYTPDSPTNPLQIYGQTKRDGENIVLQARQQGARAVVLRVPVLYGPAPNNADSAVNILVDIVRDQSKESSMDDYAIRYPTNVLDIASFLVRLTGLADLSLDDLPPILHYSANESFTKYQMCQIFADILGLNSMDHIKPVSTPPTGAGATSRPYNCHLSTTETEKLLPLECTGFRTWWEEYLRDSGK